MRLIARRADVADAAVLVDLRRHCFEEMGGLDWNQDWVELNVDHYRARLDGDDLFAAILVDAPSRPNVGCAVGWLNRHLPTPSTPTGYHGYIGQVATRPEFRTHGTASLAMHELLSWMRDQGASTVHLHATRAGEPLFEHLGFGAADLRALTIRLDR